MNARRTLFGLCAVAVVAGGAWYFWPQHARNSVPAGPAAGRTAAAPFAVDSQRLLADAPEFRPGAESRYDFLSPEKRSRVVRIDRDYAELASLIHREIRGELQPVDVARLRLLEEEKQNDLAAVLTAAEAREYELRFSSTAERLIVHLTAIDATVAEYRAAFPLQRAFEQAWRPGEPVEHPAPDEARRRDEATHALARAILGRLGPERGRLYLWCQHAEFLLLATQARKLSLHADAPAIIMTTRDAVTARGLQLLETGLSNEEKRSALARLAEEAGHTLRTALGAEAFAALGGPTQRWLTSLQHGAITTYDPLNRSVSVRTVGERAPASGAIDPYQPRHVPMGDVHIPGPFAPPGAEIPDK